MKNIFWLWEDDAAWVRTMLMAIVIGGAAWWALKAFGPIDLSGYFQ